MSKRVLIALGIAVAALAAAFYFFKIDSSQDPEGYHEARPEDINDGSPEDINGDGKEIKLPADDGTGKETD
jgi:hypothetical protein